MMIRQVRRNVAERGRRLLDENVPCEDLLHKLTAEQKVCPKCDAPLVIVLVDGLLQWAHRPAEIYGIQHVHEKGFCQCCHEHVVVADKPPQMIEKGAADASLLGSPDDREQGVTICPPTAHEEISLRHGWWLPRSTQVGWLTPNGRHGCDSLQLDGQPRARWKAPRDGRHRRSGPGAGSWSIAEGNRLGLLWAAGRVCPYLVYEYTRGGDGEAPAPGFWTGMPAICKRMPPRSSINSIAEEPSSKWPAGPTCDATSTRRATRRRSKLTVRWSTSDNSICWSGELAHAADDGRRALRQQRAMPILDEFKAWLDTLAPTVVPKTEIAAAVTYALNQWDAFVRYCDQGWLLIDNTRSERAPTSDRPWEETTGSSSEATTADERAPFSIRSSARQRPTGFTPYFYLEDVYRRLPMIRQQESLLPVLRDACRTSRTARRHPTATGTPWTTRWTTSASSRIIHAR